MNENPKTSAQVTHALHVSLRRPNWLIEAWEEHREDAKEFIATFIKRVVRTVAVFTEEVVVCTMAMILIGACHLTCEILIKQEDLKDGVHWLEFVGLTAYLVMAMLCFGKKLWRLVNEHE